VKGIPDFWLDVLLNCYEVEDMIQGEDLEMLKHMTDIACELHTDDPGFTLEFHFGENPFFSNRVLKKSYVLSLAPDAENPLDFDGPVLQSVKADAINWTRSAPSGGKRNIHGEVVRTQELPSFFDFFSGAEKVYNGELGDDEEAEMEQDFEIAMLFRDSIIPKAVLYLTDEIVQESDVDFDSDDDSSDDDEEEDDGEDKDEHMDE